MITRLTHSEINTAQQIHHVFQLSYQIEADMVGVEQFPPLLRTIENIQHSDTEFFGFFCDKDLAAVIEISLQHAHLHINSLTVLPEFFRRGIASKLIDFVLQEMDYERATVETAAVNKPAIALYQKHGFAEYKHYVPDHGIAKIALEQ